MDDASLVELAIQGNEEAKVELVDRCKEVISYHVMKYKQLSRVRLNQFDIDDLIGECYLATLQCITSYDGNRGASFPHYAKSMIKSRILDFLSRKVVKHERRRDYEADLSSVANREKFNMSDRILTRANERDKQIVALYLDGETQTAIAKKFGMHKTRIMQIIKVTIGR